MKFANIFMNDILKTPLHNLEVEQSLLGEMLSQYKIEGVKPEYFYDDKHQQIAGAILKGNSDVVSLCDFLNKELGEDDFLELGGRSYIVELVDSAQTNPEKHLQIIKQYYNRRKIIEKLQKDIELAYDEKYKCPGEEEWEDFKIVKGRDLLKAEIKENPYLIHSLIPEGAITALTADSGKGKSLVALIMAYYVASGKKFFDALETKQSNVLIIDQEMDADIIISRFQAVCKGEELPIDYLYESSWLIDDENDYKWLVDRIKENNYKLVIFDTFNTIHGQEENSSDGMKIVNRSLLKLINETGTTVLYLHHHRKLQRGDSHNQSSSRGSTEIIAKVASHILLDSKKWREDEMDHFEITLQQEKSRRPESINKIGLKLSYNQTLNETKWEYMGEIDDKTKKVEQAMEFVFEALKSGEWLSISELKGKGENIGESNLREACKKLTEDKVIRVDTGGDIGKEQKRAKYYSLPAGN